jgi:hypothetical protein
LRDFATSEAVTVGLMTPGGRSAGRSLADSGICEILGSDSIGSPPAASPAVSGCCVSSFSSPGDFAAAAFDLALLARESILQEVGLILQAELTVKAN